MCSFFVLFTNLGLFWGPKTALNNLFHSNSAFIELLSLDTKCKLIDCIAVNLHGSRTCTQGKDDVTLKDLFIDQAAMQS